MPMLQTAARRIMGKDVRRPPVPAESRDHYPSMIFSVYDQAPPPSKRLLDLSMKAIRLILDGKINLDDIAARPNIPNWFTVWPGEHYKLLAALVVELGAKNVIEIGTDAGLSALAMKKYLPADGKITTFDLRPWNTIDYTVLTEADFADGRLAQEHDNLQEPEAIARHRDLIESADFIFCDAPKDGVFEYALLGHLRKLAFKNRPIMLFDDTRLWSMLRFWRILPYPKLDLTSFGGWEGTGICEIV
jgi:hypothetical protein